MKQRQEESEIKPFEWLTSSESLKPILLPLLSSSNEGRCALHVGCGSSTLGEFLVKELDYERVLNVDNDEETLREMEHRWNRSHPEDSRMQFARVDFCSESIPGAPGQFDLVLDKSTLDCTLCSSSASTGLLCEVYENLVVGGTYVLISFHHTDLLLPMIRDMPGTEWGISHQLMKRQVEDLIGCSDKNATSKINDNSKPEISPVLDEERSAWVDGAFNPSEGYRRTVNVLLCKKLANNSLDRDAVESHIHTTNDVWYQTQNPLLSESRKKELTQSFQGEEKTLEECYILLFSEDEREHLSYSYFLEDWEAYIKQHVDIPTDRMSAETALAFLSEMQ